MHQTSDTFEKPIAKLDVKPSELKKRKPLKNSSTNQLENESNSGEREELKKNQNASSKSNHRQRENTKLARREKDRQAKVYHEPPALMLKKCMQQENDISLNFRIENQTANQVHKIQSYLYGFAEGLSGLRYRIASQTRKAGLFKKVNEIVMNCFTLDEENLQILIKNKLGAYLNVIYQLLLEINDSECAEYSLVLPNLSKLINLIKSKMLSFVDSISSSSRHDAMRM